jgi:hypothetical protein
MVIDSVKFGRFIRDSQIKPSQIGIGDIAYIFARNCAIGSKYEMQFDGFIRAIQMVATMMYPSIPEQKRLPNLFLSVMIYSTNIRPLWKQIVESWRMKIKISLLGSCSLRYCAVTRIQAKYRSLCTYRKYQQTLLMRRIRRHASIKIQSIVRMHRQRSYFLYLKSIVIRIQVFIKARHILRTLKRQRYEYIEACRLKLQRWSKYRLRILRQWKMLNARWIARRERIRKKRARKICVRVYEIEDTRFRFSLFKAIDPETEKLTDDFELDIVQPFSSQYFSTIIPNSYVKIWLQEEHHINPMGLDLSEKTESELIDLGKLSANQILGIIVSRIRWKRKFQGKNLLFSFYRSPFGTSLGKLHFHGTIRATQFCILLPQCFKYLDDEGKIQAQNQQTKEYPSIYVVVRLFQTMNYFTLLSYCPTNGERKMWQFSGLFFYSILQVFPSFTTFPLPPFISMDEALSFKHQQYAFNYVKDALNKSKRMETMRKLLSYLYAFGIKLPSHKMLPIVIENKEVLFFCSILLILLKGSLMYVCISLSILFCSVQDKQLKKKKNVSC